MTRNRIPVWLITGYLGSGKTTLLSEWLRHPLLTDVALVINEIGEVGFDNLILGQPISSAASVLTNQCICCNGLAGLEETLEEMWWARLRRERPHFRSVLIETTGLADPAPLLAAFQRNSLLQERYELQAVITTVSATAGEKLVISYDEARSQVSHADVMIITKVDCAPADKLAMLLSSINPRSVLMQSQNASVAWDAVVTNIPFHTQCVAASAHQSFPTTLQPLKHGSQSKFHPILSPVSLQEWPQWLGPLLSPLVQRLKGVVKCLDGQISSVQWCHGDLQPSFTAVVSSPPQFGITVISSTLHSI